MIPNNVQESFFSIVRREAITKENLFGCNDEEIAIVQKHFSYRLPQAYKDFLSIAGKGAGKLFRGTDIFYPRMLKLQTEAKEMLAESNLLALLPNDAKVFCMHQGYELNYFLPGSNDPPVFQFFEGQSEVVMPWKSFSEFITASIASHLKQWPDLN